MNPPKIWESTYATLRRHDKSALGKCDVASVTESKKEIKEMIAWQRIKGEMYDEYVTVKCKRPRIRDYSTNETHEANNSRKMWR